MARDRVPLPVADTRSHGCGVARPDAAGMLVLYSYVGCFAVAHLMGFVDSNTLVALGWIALALSWLAVGLWLVAAVAKRAVSGTDGGRPGSDT